MYKNIQETVSLFGIDWKLPYYISTGNRLHNLPHHSFLTDYFVIGLCVKGQVSLEFDGNIHMISANELLVLAPANILHFLSVSDDFRSVVLFFDKYYLLKNLNDPFILERLNFFKGGRNTVLKLDDDETGRFIGICDTIKEKIASDKYYKDEMIRTLIFYLLLETAEIHKMHSLPQSPTASRSEDLYFKLIDLIKIYIQQHRDVKFYAGQLFVSSKHLLQSVKNASGKTPLQIINESIVAIAMILLSDRNLNVSQVSDQLNFSSIASFSRFFKKMTGKTAVQYKNEML